MNLSIVFRSGHQSSFRDPEADEGDDEGEDEGDEEGDEEGDSEDENGSQHSEEGDEQQETGSVLLSLSLSLHAALSFVLSSQCTCLSRAFLPGGRHVKGSNTGIVPSFLALVTCAVSHLTPFSVVTWFACLSALGGTYTHTHTPHIHTPHHTHTHI